MWRAWARKLGARDMQNLMVSYHMPTMPDEWHFTPFASTDEATAAYTAVGDDLYVDAYVLPWNEDRKSWMFVDGKGTYHFCGNQHPQIVMQIAGKYIDDTFAKADKG